MSLFKIAFYLLGVIFILDDSIRGLRRINQDTKHRNLSIAWHVAGLIIAIVCGVSSILEAFGIISW